MPEDNNHLVTKHIAVLATNRQLQGQAEVIANQLNLPLIGSEDKTALSAYDFVLLVNPESIALQDNHQQRSNPIYIDFLAGKNAWRQRAGGQELLLKAAGCKGISNPYVIDATAGLGRDAFVLANFGCKVLMIERSPIMAVLLQDGLARLQADSGINNLQLLHSDATRYLADLAEADKPDIVYLDPMYPHRTKSALVKKEMRILRALVGHDEDASSLCQLALKTAKRRVVIKRPRIAETLLDKPDICFKGNNSRFDVYLLR